jgi:tRNA pseudouridine55 synthase
MTSHDVVRQVRRVCRTRKVGHAGTLDPLATGVLPVAVGDGTKILQFLLAEDKSYRATFMLGITTDTLDAEGQVLTEQVVPGDCRKRLDSVCERFRGDIQQVPPMFSALKKNGVPLYKLARRGEVVEREARPVKISRLEIVAVELPSVTIEVDCSKGTYIRSLIADIGEALGCGAHLTGLRRTKSGHFTIEECVPLDKLQWREGEMPGLLDLQTALSNYPAIEVGAEASAALHCGVPPEAGQTDISSDLAAGQLVRLQVDCKLVAMARYAPQRCQEKRGDFELIRVFVGH